jgi:hypothetical protein
MCKAFSGVVSTGNQSGIIFEQRFDFFQVSEHGCIVNRAAESGAV